MAFDFSVVTPVSLRTIDSDLCTCGRYTNEPLDDRTIERIIEGEPFCPECSLPYLEVYQTIWEFSK